ncbi:hypothetical protein [Nonomuraea sp. NPDC052265]|uniref:hypothetical protein n=1 Tax=Nonomuraea sp. NPDC052265 TaxID=3364374 RepID=UPI0037C7FA58
MNVAYVYPWDIVGDPTAPARLAELGVETIALAASYHSTRAATPYHPEHRILDVPHAAFYLPIRPHAWSRLVPAAPTWTPPDAYLQAQTALRQAGLKVHAWIVLTHNSYLGTRFPDLTVRNAFGDPYPYALCPAHEDVLTYCEALVTEILTQAEPDGLILEACGPMGFGHQSVHEKTSGADWTPTDVDLLSLCFCTTCAPHYPPETAATVRTTIDRPHSTTRNTKTTSKSTTTPPPSYETTSPPSATTTDPASTPAPATNTTTASLLDADAPTTSGIATSDTRDAAAATEGTPDATAAASSTSASHAPTPPQEAPTPETQETSSPGPPIPRRQGTPSPGTPTSGTEDVAAANPTGAASGTSASNAPASHTRTPETLTSRAPATGAPAAGTSSDTSTVHDATLRPPTAPASTGPATTRHHTDPMELALGPLANEIRAARVSLSGSLRRRLISAARRTAPNIPITLHANPNPWATGAFAALPSGDPDLHVLVGNCWGDTTTDAARLTALANLCTPGQRVGAYVLALPPRPADAAALAEQLRTYAKAGASEFHLYHAGMASPHRLSTIATALRLLQ